MNSSYFSLILFQTSGPISVEAAMEGVLRGVIGSMHQWRRIDTSRMGNFKIISSMLEARQEIAKTNLELLNSA